MLAASCVAKLSIISPQWDLWLPVDAYLCPCAIQKYLIKGSPRDLSLRNSPMGNARVDINKDLEQSDYCNLPPRF